jgi:hypothetical protein
MRLTTGVGIVLGGVGGAVAALWGASPPPPPPPAQRGPSVAVAAPSIAPIATSLASTSSPAPSTEALSTVTASAVAAPVPVPSAVPGATSTSPAPPVQQPPLELPTTRDGLLKAMLFCDQKQDFDECSRAAEALERGTAGPVDVQQAKRFRRIALTHLVAKCEAGEPHACFVMAAKYRAGHELTASPVRAEALEKRGLDLCRLRAAPECPPSP